MKRIAWLSVVVVVSVASLEVCADPPPPPSPPPPPPKGVPNEVSRVGKVYIVGNDTVPDAVVLRMLGDLQPGNVLQYPSIRVAEKTLAASGLFVLDPRKNLRPTITVIEDGESVFKDIVVNVKTITLKK